MSTSRGGSGMQRPLNFCAEAAAPETGNFSFCYSDAEFYQFECLTLQM
jgi:hypothetical protein